MKSSNEELESIVEQNSNYDKSSLTEEKTTRYKYLSFAAVISIFAVCAAHLFIKIDTPSPFVNNLPTSLITILAMYILAIWTSRFYPFTKSTPYKIVLVVALFVVFGIGISNSNVGQRGYSIGYRTFYNIPQFKGFRTHSDSPGYCKSYWKGSCRPPVYYTFMSLALGREPSNIFEKSPTENPKPFVKIIEYQRFFLALGWIFCCFALMEAVSPPIVAALFLGFFSVNNMRPTIPVGFESAYLIPIFIGLISMAILLYKKQLEWKRALLFSFFVVPLASVLVFLGSHVGFVSEQINSILSDALAQTFLMIASGLAVLFYYRGWRSILPLTAMSCGLMYQTRPAAIYGCVIIGIMILSALIRDFKKYIPSVIISIIVLVIMLVGPSMYRHRSNRLNKISSTPAHLGWSKLLFAIQIADAEDIKYIKTEEGKKFFKLAMARKKTLDKELKLRLKWQWQFLAPNLYKVAEPIISIYKMDRANILSDVCDPILFHRFDRYLNIVMESYLYSMKMSRLSSVMSVWILLFISLVLMIWVRGKSALLAGTLIATHMVNYLVICMFTNPCLRFTDASEILVLIAMFILVVDATRKIFGSNSKALVMKKNSIGFVSLGNKKRTILTLILLVVLASSGVILFTSYVKKARLNKDIERVSELRRLIKAAKLYHKKHKYLPTAGNSKRVELSGSWNSVFTKACEQMVEDGFLKEVPKIDKDESFLYFPDNFFYFPGSNGSAKPQAGVFGVMLASSPEVIKSRLENEWKDINAILFTEKQSYGGASFTADLSRGKLAVVLDFSQTEENEVERISNLRLLVRAIKLYHNKHRHVPTAGKSGYVDINGTWRNVFVKACEQMIKDGFLDEVPFSDKKFSFFYFPGNNKEKNPQIAVLGVTLSSSPEIIKYRLKNEWKDIGSILLTEEQSYYDSPYYTDFSEGKVLVAVDFSKNEENETERISNLRALIRAVKLYHNKYGYIPTSGNSEYVFLEGSWRDIFIKACEQMVADGFLESVPRVDRGFDYYYCPGKLGERNPQSAIFGITLASKPKVIKERLQNDLKDINSILLTEEQSYYVSPFYTDLSKGKLFVVVDFRLNVKTDIKPKQVKSATSPTKLLKPKQIKPAKSPTELLKPVSDAERILAIRMLVSAVTRYYQKYGSVPTSGTDKHIDLTGSWNDVFVRACKQMDENGFLEKIPYNGRKFKILYLPVGVNGKETQTAILSVTLASKPEIVKELLDSDWSDIKSILLPKKKSNYGVLFSTDLSKSKISVILDFASDKIAEKINSAKNSKSMITLKPSNDAERISILRMLVNAVKLYHEEYGIVPTSGTSNYVDLTGSWNNIFVRACKQMGEAGFLKVLPYNDKKFKILYYPGKSKYKNPQTAIFSVSLASRPEVVKELLDNEWSDINSILLTSEKSNYGVSFSTDLSKRKISVILDFNQILEKNTNNLFSFKKDKIVLLKFISRKERYSVIKDNGKWTLKLANGKTYLVNESKINLFLSKLKLLKASIISSNPEAHPNKGAKFGIRIKEEGGKTLNLFIHDNKANDSEIWAQALGTNVKYVFDRQKAAFIFPGYETFIFDTK